MLRYQCLYFDNYICERSTDNETYVGIYSNIRYQCLYFDNYIYERSTGNTNDKVLLLVLTSLYKYQCF